MPPFRTIWFACISLSYSILLFGTAMLGFKLTTQNETGWGPAILPLILAVSSLALTIMSLLIKRNYKVAMVGIHLAMIMPLAGALLLGLRAWDQYQVGQQGTQVTLAGMMAVTSIYVFVTMMLIRPKKQVAPATMDSQEKTNAIGQ